MSKGSKRREPQVDRETEERAWHDAMHGKHPKPFQCSLCAAKQERCDNKECYCTDEAA